MSVGGLATTVETAARQIRGSLERTLLELRQVADLGTVMRTVRQRDIGVWRLWYGDGCHALHGLGMWP